MRPMPSGYICSYKGVGPFSGYVWSHEDACKHFEQKTSACYVATAVYGSYDCAQVWVLRRYRDYILKKSCWGRLFICVYYKISPGLIKHFGHIQFFQRCSRKALDNMVHKLNQKGVADSRYSD
jgi:hypothetical protein